MSIKLSIIIPCYNEVEIIASCIEQIIARAHESDELEIIVADGGSIDGTLETLRNLPVSIVQSTKGRAKQMNTGASVASSELLYFLHADTVPALHFDKIILESAADAGCFRLKFDNKHWFLKANAWFTRYDINAFRFGDQSLFITKKAFQEIGNFDEKSLVFEDQEIIKRIKKQYLFKVLSHYVTTSARMYVNNGIYFTQLYYFYLFFLYKCGVSQEKILAKYRQRLSRP